MARFYIPQEVSGDTIILSDSDQLHHMRDVLRLKSGDGVTVFDTLGGEYECLITSIDRYRAELAVQSRKAAPPKRVRISIGCAIPRQSKMDEILDKLVQLDVDTIIPLETERSVVKFEDRNSLADRKKRWEKIARSAAEQSRRSDLPVINPVTPVVDVIRRSSNFDLKLMAALAADARAIKDVLAGPPPSTVLALIGPEGDFTAAEVHQAVVSGFTLISLGRTVLRVETAAIALASYLRFTFLV